MKSGITILGERVKSKNIGGGGFWEIDGEKCGGETVVQGNSDKGENVKKEKIK